MKELLRSILLTQTTRSTIRLLKDKKINGQREKYCEKILLRIIVVVKNISKNNLAFYGRKKMKTLIKVIMEFF